MADINFENEVDKDDFAASGGSTMPLLGDNHQEDRRKSNHTNLDAINETDNRRESRDCSTQVNVPLTSLGMVNQNGQMIRSMEDLSRETWNKKLDFLLSVIGFAVDLSNVWRFPLYCYRNGGGTFLIAYCVMFLIGGMPLFYMELALGQFYRKGAITCWGRICPLFKGIGYCVVLIAFYVDFYYNVILAWSLYMFSLSFTLTLPWTSCNNTWNTKLCDDSHIRRALVIVSGTGDAELGANESTMVTSSVDPLLTTAAAPLSLLAAAVNETAANFTKVSTTPAEEFFLNGVLEMNKSTGIEDLGEIKWQMLLALTAVYLICYFALWKGVSVSGKAVWFTALFPYFGLFVLLGRGLSLPNAYAGVEFFFKVNMTALRDEPRIWVDAGSQVFFSLGPGFGVLLAYASYNNFNNNVYLDAIATSVINLATSLLSGLVIFSVLGYMSLVTNKPIESVSDEGPALLFIVYPEAIATLTGGPFWAIILFMVLLTLGLDSSFGGTESILTALGDEFPVVRRHREVFIGILTVLYIIIGLTECSQGGAYVVHWLDNYAAGYSMLVATFCETVCIAWFYGIDRFCGDIKCMLGFTPGFYWRFCWKLVAPLFLLSTIIYGVYNWAPLVYKTADKMYVYPDWANALGWALALSSIICIPGMAVIQFVKAPGNTLREKWTRVITPWRDRDKFEKVVQPAVTVTTPSPERHRNNTCTTALGNHYEVDNNGIDGIKDYTGGTDGVLKNNDSENEN